MRSLRTAADASPWYIPGPDARALIALNLPAIGLILPLVGYPILFSLWISCNRYNLRRPEKTGFVGLENYSTLLSQAEFWNSLAITLKFGAVCVGSVIVIGLLISLLLHSEFTGRGVARALLLLPWAVPAVVNGLMWKGLLSKYGGLNVLLGSVHEWRFLGLQPLAWVPGQQAWLTQPEVALYATAVAHVWKEVPFATLVFLASLQAIPPELYRAARVDGAGPRRTFASVTLPWLWHPVLLVAIFETMAAFRTFDLIFTLTSGGPGRATTVIAWQAYLRAFRFLNFGAANAYSYLIALITLALTLLYIRLLYRRGLVQG